MRVRVKISVEGSVRRSSQVPAGEARSSASGSTSSMETELPHASYGMTELQYLSEGKERSFDLHYESKNQKSHGSKKQQ